MVRSIIRTVSPWSFAAAGALLAWMLAEWLISHLPRSDLESDLRLRAPGALPAPVWHFAVVMLLSLAILRAWAIGSKRGPVQVRMRSAPGQEASDAALAAMIGDVLNRMGIAPHGVIPNYSGLDSRASDVAAVSHPPISGILARVTVNFWRDSTRPRGWVLTVERRSSDLNGSIGMALELEHVATGRLVYSDTVWARTSGAAARKVAYKVAAWRFQQAAQQSTRRQPRWYSSAEGLESYDSALYYAGQRRFDETVRAASEGLKQDPSNLALRRIQGETFERLGHYLDALGVYASGLVLIRDDQNSWRRVDAQSGPD